MGTLETVRMMRKRVEQVWAILDGGPVIVQFGRHGESQAIMLPAADYAALIDKVYGPGRRVIRIDRIGLSEGVVVRMLRDQMDANLNHWTFIELALKVLKRSIAVDVGASVPAPSTRRYPVRMYGSYLVDVVGAYLVPASPFWLKMVEAGE